MSKSARDLLVRGIAAAKAGSKDEARYLLEKMLMIDPTADQRADAWVWLGKISDDPARKRDCLENALSSNPAHPIARRELAIVDGRLRTEEIVDPDRITTPAPETPQATQARRFVCRQCGGRMAFTPDGRTLTCTYCDRKLTLMQAIKEGALVKEQDFTVALATAKGHMHPVATQALNCQGCGAAFILPTRMLSSNCPYCGSAYVTERIETQELIPPEGIVPFGVNQKKALQAVRQWLQAEGSDPRVLTAPPTGVYFPVWTFDIGGEIVWHYQEVVNDGWVPRTSSKVIVEDDLVVPASRALPVSLARALIEFRLDGDEVVPYHPAYLADWPAETYEIPVANSSLVARRRVLDDARKRVNYRTFGNARDVRASSSHLVIESFKLVLLPLWIAHYRDKDKQYTIVVNGRTGAVYGQKPARGFRKLWAWLIGGKL
jgi:DNA-directed RNA polymerase subunit RPC12/RpoP